MLLLGLLLLLDEVERLLHDHIPLYLRLPRHSVLYRLQEMPHLLVVGWVCIVKTFQVVEHRVDLVVFTVQVGKQLRCRSLKARFLYLFHCVFISVLLPRQWLLEELENYEEEAP